MTKPLRRILGTVAFLAALLIPALATNIDGRPYCPTECCDTATGKIVNTADATSCAAPPQKNGINADQTSISLTFNIGRAPFVRPDGLSAMFAAGVVGDENNRLPDSVDGIASFYDSNGVENLWAAYLDLKQPMVDANAFKISNLDYNHSLQMEVIKSGGAIRQIKNHDFLIDLQPLPTSAANPAEGYTVKWYFAVDATTQDPATKIYSLPTGDPVKIAVVSNPTPFTVYKHVDVEFSQQMPGGNTRALHYRFTDSLATETASGRFEQSLQMWTKKPGETGAVQIFENHLSYITGAPVNGIESNNQERIRTYKHANLDAAGQYGALKVMARVREKFIDVGGKKRRAMDTLLSNLTSETEGLTTTYGYFIDPSDTLTYTRKKWQKNPDGSWEIWKITGSTTAQTVKVIRPFKSPNYVLADDGSNAAAVPEAECRVSTQLITGTSMTNFVTVAGQQVSKSSKAYSTIAGGIRLCTTKRFLDSGNSNFFVSYRAYHPYGNGQSVNTGRVAWETDEDGTATTYSYAADPVSEGVKVTMRSGAATGSGVSSKPTITAGTQTVTIYNQLWSAISGTSTDIASGEVIGFWHSPTQGLYGRPIKIVYNGEESDFTETKQGCCGPLETRSRSGEVTTYTYDLMQRLNKAVTKRSSTGPAITTTTVYDGLTTTTTTTDGTTTIFVGSQTQSLDRLTTDTESPDADGDGDKETWQSQTVYLATGGSTTTVTYADATISSSTTFVDGRTESSTDRENPSIDGDTYTSTYDYGTHNEQGGGMWTQVTQPNTAEWTKSYSDHLGRGYKMAYPFPVDAAELRAYHPPSASSGSRGNLMSVTDADDVTMTYGYDAEGDRTTTTRLIAGNLTQTTTSVGDVLATAAVKGQIIAPAFRVVSTVNGVVTSTSYRSIDGRTSASESLGRESFSQTTVPNDGSWTSTTTSPEGVLSRVYYVDGLMKASVTYTSDGTLPAGLPGPMDLEDENFVSGSALEHDAFGRVILQVDPRTGLTVMGPYLDNGSLLSFTAPGNRTTSFTYDSMGRRTTVDAPGSLDADGGSINNITHTSYTDRGQMKATWGDQTYPRRYDYDEQGRMTKLHTWKTAPAEEPTGNGESITEWKYHNQRGWLVEKNYHGETDNGTADADYAYTDAGRLATRTWERGVSTTYTYDQGTLSSVTYSDDTPNLDYTYDNFGRIVEVRRGRVGPADNPTTAGALHASYGYDGNFFLTTEALNQDLPHKRTLKRYYDGFRRPRSVALNNHNGSGSPVTEHSYAYSYDNAGRLKTVAHFPDLLDSSGEVLPANPGDVFTYNYEDLSANLIATIDGPHHQVINKWDPTRNVLTSKENHHLTDSTQFSKYAYNVNEIGQRTQVTQSGTAFDYDGASNTVHTLEWGYNPRGELVREHHSDASRDNAYAYDAIGNRIKDSHSTLTLPTAPTFVSNAHNQYDSLPTYKAKDGSSVTITTDHDVDGNMTSGPVPGRRNDDAHGDQNPIQASNIEWDAENRMTSITIDGLTSTFGYDYLGRRIRMNEAQADVGGVAQAPQKRSYIYDGWNLIALFTNDNNLQSRPPCAYTWGLDLSGSMQGAGGVGGLLAMRHGSIPYYPLYDGNGNVGQYIYNNPDLDLETTGNQPGIDFKARWEYDSFGRRTKSGGAFENVFLHQFSTKEKCWATGLYYYGYRYYDPVTGRWPSRDPIGEKGGISVYGMAVNDPVSGVDVLGLFLLDWIDAEINAWFLDLDGKNKHLDGDHQPHRQIRKAVKEGLVEGSTFAFDCVCPVSSESIMLIVNGEIEAGLAGAAKDVVVTVTTAGVGKVVIKVTGKGAKIVGPRIKAALENHFKKCEASTGGGNLVRFGDALETAETLAEDAAKAKKAGLPHGVSAMEKPKIKGSDKKNKSAKTEDVEKKFPVIPTGRNPQHRTIELPEPVTPEVADDFNKLFPLPSQ